MMNIQFMTEENAVTVKDSWTGEDKKVYVPNFDELVKNASCEEEVVKIREVEERMKNDKRGLFKGFAFQIVFMSYEKTLKQDLKTGKIEWVMEWQMLQHPWYRTLDNVFATKEEMIAKIEKMRR